MRVRPGRPGLLGLLDLVTELAGLGLAEPGPQARPDPRLLERDVITSRTDELSQQDFEFRVTGIHLVELGQDLLALLLLADRLMREPVAVGQPVAHRRPKVHLLGGLVPGFLDDQGLCHLLAQGELVRAGRRGRRGPGFEFRQHLLDFLMVVSQYLEDARHDSSRFTGYICREPSSLWSGRKPAPRLS